MNTESVQHGGVIVCTAVRYQYADGTRALRGLSLRVERGEAVALLGSNGSGKSTLMRVLAGLDKPEDGEVMPPSGRVGMVFQRDGLDGLLRVRENLMLQGQLLGLSRREAKAAAREALAKTGMEAFANRRVDRLSGGERRRADLARALIGDPAALLLDEPTAGLDAEARLAFIEHVLRLRDASGISALHATHLGDEAERCDRVVVLDRGEAVYEGSPGALLAHASERVLEVETSANSWREQQSDTLKQDTACRYEAVMEKLGLLDRMDTPQGVMAWGEFDTVQRASVALGELGVAVRTSPPNVGHAQRIVVHGARKGRQQTGEGQTP